MRVRGRRAILVFAVLVATGCGGLSTEPLPEHGCTLLSDAEVSAFLGKIPTCAEIQRTAEPAGVAAVWQATPRAPSVKAALSRAKSVEDQRTFETEAGAYGNAGAKVVAGIGDDAVLVIEPHSPTSGSIAVLHDNDVIIVAVSRGALSGDALATALTAAGRRLVQSYSSNGATGRPVSTRPSR